MKLLLDENLSRRIVPFLQNEFPGSSQITLVGLERADDQTVWSYAKEHGYIIVTRDGDFEEMSIVFGKPPQLLWIRTPNQSKAAVLNLLLAHAVEIKHALTEGNIACVELGSTGVDFQSPERSNKGNSPPRKPLGFTLTELAIVMFVVALMLGGMLLPLSAQQDIRQRQETERVLNETRDALMGYVAINGRLPCPDTNDDGVENGSSSGCASGILEGDFPFQTVGSARSDGWGYRLRYRVAPDFSTTISLASLGNINVVTRGDDPTTAGTTEQKKQNSLIANAPAVIMSVGKNGLGGLPNVGGVRNGNPAAGTDEFLNNTGTTKVARNATEASAGCSDDEVEANKLCAFDDQLVWLSANTIIHRLISAGKL